MDERERNCGLTARFVPVGGEKMVADFADGAETGFAFGDVVGGGAGFGDGSGDADAKAGGAEGGDVDHVVTHVGAGGEREAESGGELGEGGEFIGAGLG